MKEAELVHLNYLFTKQLGAKAYRTTRQARLKSREALHLGAGKNPNQAEGQTGRSDSNIQTNGWTARRNTLDNLAEEQWIWADIYIEWLIRK